MTKKEAAIVAAYTGYVIGDLSTMHAYIEKLMGRPVWTHELPALEKEIHNRSKADFIALSANIE